MTPSEELAGTLAAAGDVQAALDAGLANADPVPLDRNTLYSLALPHGGAHMVLDTEQYGARPSRPRATYRPATVDALMAVIERYKDEDTTIWVHPTSGRTIAVFNDNADDTAGWRDHRAELVLQPTPEWLHWESKDNIQMSQEAFAEHIEDGLLELVEPAAADMLELAQTVEATKGANFRSAIRLQDGQVQAKYEETIDAKAGQSGQLTIPTEFTLAIAPFLGENPYSVSARFRYRLNSGRLTLGYRLERPDAVIRDALTKIAERLSTHFADIPILIGEPA
jgi:uncharacterized protein YfdQ (DUF2303 family)